MSTRADIMMLTSQSLHDGSVLTTAVRGWFQLIPHYTLHTWLHVRRATSGTAAPRILAVATGRARLRLAAVAMATRRRNDAMSVRAAVNAAGGHVATVVLHCTTILRSPLPAAAA